MSSKVPPADNSASLIRSSSKVFATLKAKNVTDVIVGYSCGKDSLTVLDLCVKAFGPEHVRAFFLYTLPDLECEARLANLPTTRYGIEVLKYPLPEVMSMIRDGYARYTPPSYKQLLDRKYGWNEIEKLIRYKTGLRWLCYGHRKQDSLHRRGMLDRCEGVWETTYSTNKPVQRAFPIWEWSHKDVLSYLTRHHIPIPHMFGSTVINTSGLSLLDPDTLLFVKEKYPHDYARLRRVFPQLDTPIFRQEVLQRAFAGMEENDEESQKAAPRILQQTSELFETELAKILKIEKTRNNAAMDWIARRQSGVEVGIELKVLNKAEDGQDRVQMRPSARKRKMDWLLNTKKLGDRVGYTILVDNRDNYSGGVYRNQYSGHRIYLASGFGAFRLSSMRKIESVHSLAKIIYDLENPKLGDVNRLFEDLLKRTFS